VGLVFIALSGAAGDRVRRVHFPSDRDRVRYQSTQSALEMIRRGLLGLSPCDRGATLRGRRPSAPSSRFPWPTACAGTSPPSSPPGPSLPDVRFVRDEGVHVTLRFLGWTRAETLRRSKRRSPAPPPPARPSRWRCADSARSRTGAAPRPLARPRLPAAARRLQAACEAAAVATGFEPEPRAFHPHLTLGRWRGGRGGRRCPTWTSERPHVGAHPLPQRHPPVRSVYTPLAVFPLGGAGSAVR
jgi:2'-5' RNA ligase